MAVYTTSNLLDNIDRRAFSPTNQNVYSSSERLALITEEMETHVFPAIFNTYQEFYVTRTELPLVVGQELYQMPARAVNSMLREVKITRGDDVFRDLDFIDVEYLTSQTREGQPINFFMRNNRLGLSPIPNDAQQSLLLDYYVHPGTAVLPSAAAVITGIDTVTKIVSFSSVPSTYITGTVFDFIRGSGEHEYIGTSYTASLVSGTDVTFSSLPQDLAVGDYMALEGESPLIQCPTVFRNVLAQYVAARILLDQGQSGADNAFARAEQMLARAVNLIQPRVTGAMQTLSASWTW